MSFRLVPKSVSLNGVMAVTLRYFTKFGKLVIIALPAKLNKYVKAGYQQIFIIRFFVYWS